MKKIVALVLSLVMVLGLATTAFAATTSTGSVATSSVTVKNATLFELATVGGSMSVEDDDITEIEKTTVSGKIVDDVAMTVPTIYEIDGVFYAEVAKAAAGYALKNDGKMVYLAVSAETDVADVIDEFATDVVLDKFVAPVEVLACGDAIDSSDASAAIYMDGDDAYYAAGSDWAVFKGEFVNYDADTTVEFVPHDWDANSVIVRNTDVLGVQVPVSIKCDACEKTFKIVDAGAFDKTWVEGVDYEAYGQGYFIVLGASAPAAGSDAAASDKVESAETFDAGIAMYVGMSVMAAAGSAVVLKKKD